MKLHNHHTGPNHIRHWKNNPHPAVHVPRAERIIPWVQSRVLLLLDETEHSLVIENISTSWMIGVFEDKKITLPRSVIFQPKPMQLIVDPLSYAHKDRAVVSATIVRSPDSHHSNRTAVALKFIQTLDDSIVERLQNKREITLEIKAGILYLEGNVFTTTSMRAFNKFLSENQTTKRFHSVSVDRVEWTPGNLLLYLLRSEQQWASILWMSAREQEYMEYVESILKDVGK